MPTHSEKSDRLESRHPDLEAEDLKRLGEKLQEELKEALGQLEHDLQEGRGLQDTEPEDFPGHATFEATRDQIFALSEAERERVRLIEEALQRIGDGSYGLCQYDEQPIPVPRLEAVPWARYCFEHEDAAEKGRLGEE